MILRSAASGWVRAGFFALLSLVVFLVFRKAMARGAHSFAAFAYTFLGLAAVPVFDELRRRNRRGTHADFEMAPKDATYEKLTSPRQLLWPIALVLWVLLPATLVAAGVNLIVGEAIHDVAGSMGSVVAVATGALAGLAAWMALRTLSVMRLGDTVGRWPLWLEAPPPSLTFRALASEWRRRQTYYFQPPSRHLRAVP